MRDVVCPVDVLAEARRLASKLAGDDLPLAYDPGNLGWHQNLLRIAREYTNYDAIIERLEDWIVAQLKEGNSHCALRSLPIEQSPDQRCPNCPNRWAALHVLSQAAEKTAERLYQRWLARKALADRRAGSR